MSDLLGKREKAVLILVSQGFQAKEIASMHGVHMFTIRRQLENIHRKLEARNSAHAVLLAIQKGIIAP